MEGEVVEEEEEEDKKEEELVFRFGLARGGFVCSSAAPSACPFREACGVSMSGSAAPAASTVASRAKVLHPVRPSLRLPF